MRRRRFFTFSALGSPGRPIMSGERATTNQGGPISRSGETGRFQQLAQADKVLE